MKDVVINVCLCFMVTCLSFPICIGIKANKIDFDTGKNYTMRNLDKTYYIPDFREGNVPSETIKESYRSNHQMGYDSYHAEGFKGHPVPEELTGGLQKPLVPEQHMELLLGNPIPGEDMMRILGHSISAENSHLHFSRRTGGLVSLYPRNSRKRNIQKSMFSGIRIQEHMYPESQIQKSISFEKSRSQERIPHGNENQKNISFENKIQENIFPGSSKISSSNIPKSRLERDGSHTQVISSKNDLRNIELGGIEIIKKESEVRQEEEEGRVGRGHREGRVERGSRKGKGEKENETKEETMTRSVYRHESIRKFSDQINIDNSINSHVASVNLCRSMENFLPPDLYLLDTCALCYGYILNRDLFSFRWIKVPYHLRNYTIWVLMDPLNHTHVEHATVDSVLLKNSFSGEEGLKKWHSCCRAAQDCCEGTLQNPYPKGHCPPTWDGWQCWSSTPPSTEVKRTCPSYSYHGKAASCPKMASKQCEEDGQWFRLSRDGHEREWSNYSSCSVTQSLFLRLYVHIAADCLSAAALMPALFIFFSYKQLRVHRITLHKHLFISLLLEATGNISFRLIQLHREELIKQSPTWCITLNMLTRYAGLTNYMWYLCEGYYLHKLLASAFAEQNSLIIFYLIGWVFPLIPLSIYGGLRVARNDHSSCWLVPVDLDWIMYLPPLLALLFNIVFLVNIIRILVSKVRATNSDEPSQYRKAVRATMMVVPLFGLQYIVTIYRPQGHGCDWHDFYQICNNLIEGSTGAVVAIIFCYTNGEVKSLLRRSWERFQERRAPQGTYLGSQAAHSRSFSTVQTTLVDPSPARRASSVISVCINSQLIRRSGSSGLRSSKNSNLTLNESDGNSQMHVSPRRSSKHSLSSLTSGHVITNSISKSPQLLEEIEDSVNHDDSTAGNYGKAFRNSSSTASSTGKILSNEIGSNTTVVFCKNQEEPTVNINVGGNHC